MRRPLRWAVVIVSLDPTKGHEQAGTRRVLVVSYEPFHRSGLMTIVPITAARSVPRYPGEVAIPAGEAGQTRDGVVLCHQVRTISADRVVSQPVRGPRGPRASRPPGYLMDPELRAAIRRALAHQLGLDIPAQLDGAAA